MKDLPKGEAPAYLLVYFGVSSEQNKNSGYTYGLYKFNLPEVEIVGSDRSVYEVHGVCYNPCLTYLPKANSPSTLNKAMRQL